jgi:Tol biopolymer transport system component
MKIKPSREMFIWACFICLLVSCILGWEYTFDRRAFLVLRYPSFRRLAINDSFQNRFARWSPNGKQIIFMGGHGATIANSDGSDQKPFVVSDLTPSGLDWSPDGKKIVFGSRKIGAIDIYIANLDGSEVVKLTNTHNAGGPLWSPDGRRIAFRIIDGREEEGIYLIDTDGTNLFQLTHYPLVIGDFEWSPDSTQIAFTADDKSRGLENPILLNTLRSPSLYTINADGSNLKLVSQETGDAQYPMWSPDGESILFLNGATPMGFFLVDASGSELKKVLDGLYCDEPSLSRANNHLVCSCQSSPAASQLCTIDMAEVLK